MKRFPKLGLFENARTICSSCTLRQMEEEGMSHGELKMSTSRNNSKKVTYPSLSYLFMSIFFLSFLRFSAHKVAHKLVMLDSFYILVTILKILLVQRYRLSFLPLLLSDYNTSTISQRLTIINIINDLLSIFYLQSFSIKNNLVFLELSHLIRVLKRTEINERDIE